MGDPAVLHTTLDEIRLWIARRRIVAERDPWVAMIVNASDWDEMIARACA